jgi:transposase
MLKLDQVHVIRHKVLVDGRSSREVATEMGVSRNTVRRYLEVAEPRRVERKARARPVLEKVQERLDELLAEWRERTTAKQRLTGTRLHRELVTEGHSVGVTVIRDYVREQRRQAAEVYIPLVHRAGDEVQVDFFEVVVEVEGERRKAWKFLMRLMYSGRDFAWLYERCDQLAFLDGHVRAFDHFGGVPRRGIYDNLTAAVKRVTFPRRQLSERFQALASHYLFEPCFARPGEGHDKGGVEARGRGIRLQQMTPIPRGRSLAEIAEALLERLNAEKGWQERFAEEKAVLRPLPSSSFEARRVVPVRVRQSATIQVEGAWYSVSSRWAGLSATAYIGVEDVRIVCRGEEVTHPRQRFGGRSIRYRHYLSELARKPQAVRQVAPELVAELGEPYGQLWALLLESHSELDAARTLARVLGAVCEQGEEAVQVALTKALTTQRANLLALLPVPTARPEHNPVPLSLACYEVPAGRAADYDHLLLAATGA